MDLSKQAQLNYRGRKHPETQGMLKEEPVQDQLNDLLAALQILSIRIPDGIFKHIKMKCSIGFQRWFFGLFGGIPDSLAFIKISDKYMLCCPIECKSKTGQLHGKQKHWKHKGIPVQITRSPEDSMAIVREFVAEADRLKAW